MYCSITGWECSWHAHRPLEAVCGLIPSGGQPSVVKQLVDDTGSNSYYLRCVIRNENYVERVRKCKNVAPPEKSGATWSG